MCSAMRIGGFHRRFANDGNGVLESKRFGEVCKREVSKKAARQCGGGRREEAAKEDGLLEPGVCDQLIISRTTMTRKERTYTGFQGPFKTSGDTFKVSPLLSHM